MHIQVTAPFRLQGCVSSFVGCSSGPKRSCSIKSAQITTISSDVLRGRYGRRIAAATRIVADEGQKPRGHQRLKVVGDICVINFLKRGTGHSCKPSTRAAK